jgi:CubicO group peptidase (beta-lactamase class C family)
MMMKNSRKFLSLAMLLLMTSTAVAQVEINRETVKEWADDFFSQSLAEKRLSGAVISVVKDGELIFSKGYGYADYAAKTLIDPNKTRFMIGSTSKTFTATAFAQLMDRGLIDSLDDPANKYLKRDTLPKVDGKEITLRQLITHTAGFGNITFHISNDKDLEYPLSAEEITSRRPPIVRKPGGRFVYSNYSTTIIGVIVEDITGQALNEYFQENIFDPLGMSNTELNMSTRPSENQAKPYVFYPNGEAEAVDYYNIHPFFSAVGAITSTAEDMAKYMLAQMEEGRGETSPLKISPETFKKLHGRLVSNHPDTQGFGMIFMTETWGKERGYGHGGDYPGFHSIMWMLPEKNVALFFSLMAEYPGPPVMEGIMGSERMTPDPDHPVGDPITNVGTAAEFLIHFLGPDIPLRDEGRLNVDDLVGSYRHEYRAYGSMEEILDMFNGLEGVATVEKARENEILINGRGPYAQVGKGVFWNADLESSRSGSFGQSAIFAFSWDEDEKRYFATPRFAIDPFVQLGTFDNPRFYDRLLMIGLILALTGLLAVAWKKPQQNSEKWARRGAIVLPFLIIAVPLSLLVGYPQGESVASHLMLGNYSRYIVAGILSNLLFLMTLAQIYFAYKAWKGRYWGDGTRAAVTRIHASLIAIAALLATIAYWFYNFVGFNLP